MKNFITKQNTQSSTDVQETTDTANEENSVRTEMKNLVSSSQLTLGSADYQTPDTDPTQLSQATVRYAMQGDVYRDTSASANAITCERFAGGQLPYPNSNKDFVPIEGDIIRVRVSNTTTGATTLSFYNSADYPVKKRDDSDVTVGFLKANAFYEFLFTDTSVWEVVSESAYASEALEAVTPVGTVQSFYMDSAPAGWLEADGSAIDSVKYPKLATLLGTNLPNLQGHSLVGKKTGETLGDNVGEHPYAHRHLTSTASNLSILEDTSVASFENNMRIGLASTGGAYFANSITGNYSTSFGDGNWGNMYNNGWFAYSSPPSRLSYGYKAAAAAVSVGNTYVPGILVGLDGKEEQAAWAQQGAFDYFSPYSEAAYMSFSGHDSPAALLGGKATEYMGVAFDQAAGKWKGFQQINSTQNINSPHQNSHLNDIKGTTDFKANFDATGADFPSTKVFTTTNKVEKRYCEFGDTMIAGGSMILDARGGKTLPVNHNTVAPDTAPFRYKVNTRQVGTSYGFQGTHDISTQIPKEIFEDSVNKGNFDRQYGVGIVWGIKHDY